jgi:hypothetical protein
MSDDSDIVTGEWTFLSTEKPWRLFAAMSVGGL